MNYKDYIKSQPVVNIGMIGHVSNGKSSITKAITGKATQQHSDEKVRNITIKLGYANAKIFKCNSCNPPNCYKSASSDTYVLLCEYCESEMELINHISFVDCPGHNAYMANMLNGACVMDYTILVESIANDIIPAPQTEEHILATTIAQIPNKLVCMNKLDLEQKNKAIDKINKFKDKLKNSIAENSPIIPISATFGINIDVLCHYLSNLEPKKKDILDTMKMIIIRSFNVNKPGINFKELNGGVIGGTITEGKIKLDDEIIIKPGFITSNKITNNVDSESSEIIETRFTYRPLKTKVLSINSENVELEEAISGGLIGIQLDIDPGLTTMDKLVGQLILNKLNYDNYKVYEEIKVNYKPITEFRSRNVELKKNLQLVININATNCLATIKKISDDYIKLVIDTKPICAKIGDRITLSVRGSIVDNHITNANELHVIGIGEIIGGSESTLVD